ncbi:MAG: methyltransferase domain-containing protein [Thermoanaerobaculia bacterium]
MDAKHTYVELAAAYVRGKGLADEAGLHRFKRTVGLPRVQRVIGALRALAPRTLLDVGSGRGTFLWPLLDAIPDLPVLAIDRLPYRVADVACVRRGGIGRLTAARMDVNRLALADRSFDVVTVLEVLEHLELPQQAAKEAFRVAERAVVASVPSKEDDNPEHLHLFDKGSLEALFLAAGARRVAIDYVLNHIIAVALR